MLSILFEGPRRTGKTTLIEEFTDLPELAIKTIDGDGRNNGGSKIRFVYDATKNEIVSHFAAEMETDTNLVLEEIGKNNPIVINALRYYEGVMNGMQKQLDVRRERFTPLPSSPPSKKRKLEETTVIRLYENELQLEQYLNPWTLFPTLKYLTNNFLSQLILNSLFLEKGIGIDKHIFFVIYSYCMMQEYKNRLGDDDYIRVSNDLFTLLSERLLNIERSSPNNSNEGRKGLLEIISVPTHIHTIYVYPKTHVNCKYCIQVEKTMGSDAGRDRGFQIFTLTRTEKKNNDIIHLFIRKCIIAMEDILDILFHCSSGTVYLENK